MKMSKPSRGDIWLVDLNPVKGHEQAGVRPVLVISVDIFNHGPAGLAVVVPLTTKNKGIPLHVGVPAGEGGLIKTSFIKCEDLRSITVERFSHKLGSVSYSTLLEVEDKIRILLVL